MLFTKIGYGIAIPINKDYTVRANVICTDRETGTYTYNYEICRNDIGKYDGVGLEDVITIVSKNVNVDIAKTTHKKYREGFFNHFIERYEYELKATDIGLDALEKERFCK